MKKLIILISIFSIIFILGKNILPTNNYFFDFHDETQPARIHQFVLNLKNLQIPPRIAPQFSFNLGFPVFNYYAPTSYWITSLFNLLGFSIIDSLKISFILALIVAFLSMYSLTSSFFSFYQSILASLLYVSSSWMAVEIFIRGNLAELWFLAFLPLSFWVIYKNSKSSSSSKFFVLTVFILGVSLTTHNVLSLVLLPLLIIFVLINENKKRNFLALILSLVLNSYFFIPAILEMNQTHASLISKHTNYSSHLLCLWQLWTTPFWGYGGSGTNCINDGMPFMIGKPQIIFGILGLVFIISLIIKKNKNSLIYIYFILLTLIFIYLSTYLSYPLSLFFNQYLGFFQFPWRFLGFVVFGTSFLASGFFSIKLKKIRVFLFFLGLMILIYNSKFFTKNKISNEEFNKNFLNEYYISNRVAYKIAEYLPKTVDYKTWLKYEPKNNKKYLIDEKLKSNFFVHYLNGEKPEIIINDNFYKKAKINKNEKIIINISYMSYWKIFADNKQIIPKNLDNLGRPIINLPKNSILEVKYQQTLIQKISNIITLFTMIYLIYLFFRIKKIL